MHLTIAIDPGTVFQGVAYRRDNEKRVTYGSIVLPSANFADLELFMERIESEKFGRQLLWQLPNCTSISCVIERPDRRISLKVRKQGLSDAQYRQQRQVIKLWKRLILHFLFVAAITEVDSLKWQRTVLGRDWSGTDRIKRLSVSTARQQHPTLSVRTSDHIGDAVCLLYYYECLQASDPL